MSSRKEELLAMLKNTLALSRSSLKIAPQEQAANKPPSVNPSSQRSSVSVPNVTYDVDEEDEFLYGKSETFEGVSKYRQAPNQRFQEKLEASYDYNHGGSSKEKNVCSRDNTDLKYEFNGDNPQKQSSLKYNQYSEDGKGFYDPTFKVDQEAMNYEYAQSAYSSKLTESAKYECSDKSAKKQDAGSLDSNKLLDTILKTISMDENLSKIIVEKMKKPEAGKLNENISKADVEEEKTQHVDDTTMVPMDQELNITVHFSDRPHSVDKLDSQGASKKIQSLASTQMKTNKDISQASPELTDWNKKTEEFLKKLQNQNSNPKDMSGRNSTEKSSRTPERKKLSPLKQKPDSVEGFNKTGLQSNVQETNVQEIIETINAIEAELGKLEHHRQLLLTKPMSPENENILSVNLKTQHDMKTQLVLLKETFSQMECQKLKNIALSSSTVTNKTKKEPSNPKRISEDRRERSKRRSRSRSRSRGYKRSRTRSRSRSSGRYGQKRRYYDSKSSYHKSSYGSQHRRSDRSRSRSRSRRDDVRRPSDSEKRDSSESKITNITKEARGQIDVKEKMKMEEKVADVEISKIPTVVNPNNMLENVKFGIEFAIALFMKANTFFDGGNLWCQHCDKIFESFYGYCTHLHTEEHMNKSGDKTLKKEPVLPRDHPSGPQSAPARGDEFIKPVQAFSCSLCKEFFEDSSKVKAHFTSGSHNAKFKEFLVKNSSYEIPYLARRMNALFKKECTTDAPPKKSAEPFVDIFEDQKAAKTVENVPINKSPFENTNTMLRMVGPSNVNLGQMKAKSAPFPNEQLSRQQLNQSLQQQAQKQVFKPKDATPPKPMSLQPFKLNNTKNLSFKRR